MWDLFYELWQVGSFGFPGGSVVKNPPTIQETQVFDPSVGEIPWRRKWQLTLVFLTGKSHGQRSLAGLQSMGVTRVKR